MTNRRLFVNGRFIGGGQGAVNSVARDLTLAIHRRIAAGGTGWDIELAISPDLAPAAAAMGIPLRTIGHRSGIAWEQTELPALRRQGVVAGFFNTVPLVGTGYVTMLHDAHVFTAPGSYGRATRTWRRLLSRRAAAPGNRVLTVSDYSRQTLLDCGLGHPDRIGVVPNGLGQVATVRPDPAILARLGLAAGVPWCVGLASLLPHKNIGLLLRAFDAPALSGLRLVLVGKAGRAEFDRAGLRAAPNVAFAGYVSDAELAALYAGATAVCVPSTEEGFGLPALEGMAHGAVALVAHRGALPEVVANAGILLPPDDPAAWHDALLGLLADPQRRAAIGQAGRARATAFTWDAAAGRALACLDQWFPQGDRVSR